MEKENREASDGVQIPKPAYEGLEVIRRAGATNKLDRPIVINVARELELKDTADRIESVDTDTYSRLILLGPDVIGHESLDENLDRMDRACVEDRKGLWEGGE